MQAIHRTRQADTKIAYDSLKYLITSRLLPEVATSNESEDSVQVYLEKACITYIHFATKDPASISVAEINELEKILNAAIQKTTRSLSETATHAAQTLMWKAVGASNPGIAERLTALLRHPLFDNAGHLNKARIGR